MNIQDTMNARLVYKNVRDILMANGLDPDRTVNTQSYLRLEAAASTSTNVYNFPVLQNNGQQYATENRLVLQDSFITALAGVFWYIPSASGIPGPSDRPLLSWPNPNLFTTSGAANAAESLYNGFLTVNVNKKVVVPSWDLFRSRVVNQTQLTAATNSPVDQLDGGSDVLTPIEPNWFLIGSRNSVITITVPNAFAAIQANSRIVVLMRGLLIQDSTSVQ